MCLYKYEDDYIKDTGGRKFDVIKFVLAIMILLLHSNSLPHFFLPIMRMAVPLFFIMTSYFFFLKYIKCILPEEKKCRLIKFLKRNFFLYIFYCIILLPITIKVRPEWFDGGILYTITQMLKSFLFTGFFKASWFILASIYSILIVSFFSKYLNNKWMLIGSILFYILACLDSNYAAIVGKDVIDSFNHDYFRLCNSFFSALVWVIIGKILAEQPIRIKTKWMIVSVIIPFTMLYFEHFLIRKFSLYGETDCYLSLLVCVPIIFIMIGQSNFIKGKDSVFCRKASVIIYCTHVAVLHVVRILLCGQNVCSCYPVEVILLSLLGCLVISLVLIRLSKLKLFNILKYSY